MEEIYLPYTSASCPDLGSGGSILGGSSLSTMSAGINDTQSEISTKESELQTKVDNGNTELLRSDIQLATDATYTELVQEIQTIDSYLSDEAAIEFMEKPTEREVAKTIALAANSPLPEKAKAEIENLDVSEDLKAYLQAQQNGVSKREQAERNIRQLKYQKHLLLKKVLHLAYRDETGEVFDQAIGLLMQQEDFRAREMAYHMLISANRHPQAESLMAELKLDLAQLSEAEQYQMEDYLTLLELETELETELDAMDEEARIAKITEQADFLTMLKDNPASEGSMMAELLLTEAGLYEAELVILLPNPQNASRDAVQYYDPKPKHFNMAMSDILEVYPNPVDEHLTVEYIMFNGMSSQKIGIYDINGRLLKTQPLTQAMDIIEINVSELSSGTYLIGFGTEGAAPNAKKFIVK